MERKIQMRNFYFIVVVSIAIQKSLMQEGGDLSNEHTDGKYVK